MYLMGGPHTTPASSDARNKHQNRTHPTFGTKPKNTEYELKKADPAAY